MNWNAQILPKKWQVFYISPAGDYAGSNAFPDNVPFYSWCLLSSVEVAPLWPTSAVVALGDSITDGVGSTPPLNDRWPDLLAARLYNSFNFLAPSVVNNRFNQVPLFEFGSLTSGEKKSHSSNTNCTFALVRTWFQKGESGDRAKKEAIRD